MEKATRSCRLTWIVRVLWLIWQVLTQSIWQAVFEDAFSQSALLRTEEMAKKMDTKVFHTQIHSLNRAKEVAIRDYGDFVDEFLEYE